MPSEKIVVHELLGPRARPPLLVRFGVWFVLAILAAAALIGSLISYRDHVILPVEFTKTFPIQSQAGGGRIRILVTDGSLVDDGQAIARLEPGEPGVAMAVARVPAPFSNRIKRGDLLACETRDAGGVHRGMARVDSVLSADQGGVVVRVALAGEPAKGFLTVVGDDHSVVYRLVGSLLKK